MREPRLIPIVELTLVAAARVPARAGGRVLGVRVPAADGVRAGHRLPRGAGAGGGGRRGAGRRQHHRPAAQRRRRRAGAAAGAGRRRRRAATRPGRGGADPRAAARLSLRPLAAGEPDGAAGRRRRAPAQGRTRRADRHPRRQRRGAGLALHRLADPGAAGHEHHGHQPVEHRLLGGRGALAQAAQAADGDADAASAVPGLAPAGAAGVPGARSGGAARLRLRRLRRRRCAARSRSSPG